MYVEEVLALTMFLALALLLFSGSGDEVKEPKELDRLPYAAKADVRAPPLLPVCDRL